MLKKLFFIFASLSMLAVFIGTTYFLYNKSQEKPITFTTTEAFHADIINKTVATGKIVPRKEIEIKPQVSGVIEQLYVSAGDILEKGDLIAKIQLIPNMQQLNNAESSLEKARLNLHNTQLEFKRQQTLFKENLISEVDFNKFKLQYDLTKEAVNSTENNLALIREGASKKSDKVANLVRSTVSGMVLDVPVEEGTFVTETNNFNAGSTIASIANMKDLIFEGKLDESEVGKVSVGMPLILTIGAIDNKEFNANLDYISPKGINDQGTIKFEIKASIEMQSDTFLRAGYSANANIVIEQRNNVLAINEGNLIFDKDDTYVDVEVKAQEFKRQKVTTGISDGINIEILSGLQLGTQFKKLAK